jgi:amino acid transporter
MQPGENSQQPVGANATSPAGTTEGMPLVRGLGLVQATALNMANMVGIGPFITIPLFLATMGGPQVLIGWVIAAVLVLCDGLVWSELGAALPGSGGTYHYLREIFGRYRWGRLMPFLFIWQFLISGTLELASGYVGGATYLKYIFPGLAQDLAARGMPWVWNGLAAAGCVLVTLVLCRRIQVVGWLGVVLCIGTLVTMLTVIVTGLTHFNPQLLRMPANAFHLNWTFALGLGAAMRIAVYDYLGYYNICHLGEEVRNPGRTIPRAVIISVVVVAACYLTMNVSIIGVVPWQEAAKSSNIAAEFMERLHGRGAAVLLTWLVVWTALASVFSMTLGYSRIPYAAARAGDFFRVFSRVHPRHHYPGPSLLAMGGLTAAFCFLSLETLVGAAVTVRILVQFIGQIAALHLLRTRRPDIPLPFRMKFYPLPSLVALGGWLFLWGTSGWLLLALGLGVILSGTIVFLIWRRFGRPGAAPP